MPMVAEYKIFVESSSLNFFIFSIKKSFNKTTAKAKLIKENPLYANVICRCEMVTEGEIVDAIHRPLGATTIDGIKRRTRAGMGRCQAGFCLPKTIEILARELNTDITNITKNGNDSKYVFEHKSN